MEQSMSARVKKPALVVCAVLGLSLAAAACLGVPFRTSLVGCATCNVHQENMEVEMQQMMIALEHMTHSVESMKAALRGPRVHLAFDWDMPFDVQVMEHPSVEAVQHQLAAIGREKLLELSDCLDAFVAPEFLGDGNKVYCSKCKSQQRVRKQIDIWREPDILIVHIKRFQFNGTCFEKLGQHIEPPEEFDLGKWIAKRDEYVVEGAIYTLYGIATHHGGLSGGHYFSTCANSAGDETTWYKFNDTVVTKYTPEEFKAASSHRQGYVLFYRKQNLSASNLINYALVAPRPDVQTPPEQSGRLWSA